MADTLLELKGEYDSFLRQERYEHVDRISTAIDDYAHRSKNLKVEGWGCPRVNISMSELRSFSELSKRLRQDPLRHLRAIEAAAHEIAQESRPGYDKSGVQIKVALSGPIGARPLSPRELNSSILRQLVAVEGVATKVSAIKPKVVKSVHYCPATKQHSERSYVDSTDPHLGLHAVDSNGLEQPDRIINITPSVYPTKDKNGNPLETEFGLSVFKDHQTITLQEMPERAPMGQLPRSVELILDHDLVDKIKPGDRVQIVGVYRALAPGGATGRKSHQGVFKTVVLVNNVQILGRDSSQITFSPEDVRSIKALGKRPDILEVLGRSISPSIHGHEVIKKALALQLLSGCEKNLKNGTHLRGDINILMVGDPSTAKSQLLRSAMMIAPLAVSTSGKGSSGVGLTAAVTSDPDTGERRLEAGAMVLADRGLVCVDEFDKMGENDRVAIHEAMEQQTVTIAKAGIHASLNARCSVLAAANPVYGQYDRNQRIQANIGLPDSLLSRFDLLFVVLDQMDPVTDRKISNHVISGHRYRPDHGLPGHDSDYDEDSDDDEDDDNNLLGGDNPDTKVRHIWQGNRHDTEEDEEVEDVDDCEQDDDKDPHASSILQHDFLRKYLHFAKNRPSTRSLELTDGAREFIANRYAELRCRQDERTLPVTARTLETVIRLASAHAKARLSDKVEAEPDCQVAMDILSFALYHENGQQPQSSSLSDSPESSELEEEEADDAASTTPVAVSDSSILEDEALQQLPPPLKKQKTKTCQENLRSRIFSELQQQDGEINMEDLCSDISDREELEELIALLVRDGRLHLDDGVLYMM